MALRFRRQIDVPVNKIRYKSEVIPSRACISNGSRGVKQVTLPGSPYNGNRATRESFCVVYSPQKPNLTNRDEKKGHFI